MLAAGTYYWHAPYGIRFLRTPEHTVEVTSNAWHLRDVQDRYNELDLDTFERETLELGPAEHDTYEHGPSEPGPAEHDITQSNTQDRWTVDAVEPGPAASKRR